MATNSRLRAGKGLAVAIVLVGGFEGLRNAAYMDPVGIPTICFGETRGVKMGDHKTTDECKVMLGNRLVEFETGVRGCLRNPDALPDGPYIASISLAYNIGVSAFCKSSALRLINEGKIRQGCDAFNKFVYAKGIYFPGLAKRRAAERELCLKGAV
jgi:lysozyme